MFTNLQYANIRTLLRRELQPVGTFLRNVRGGFGETAPPLTVALVRVGTALRAVRNLERVPVRAGRRGAPSLPPTSFAP